MKKLKVAILLCGLVGLAELVIPLRGGSMVMYLFRLEPAQAIVLLAAFVLPVIMMAMALSRPPTQGWQAGISLAGFVIAVIKFRVWDVIPHLGAAGINGILLVAAILVGAITSVIALIRPEA